MKPKPRPSKTAILPWLCVGLWIGASHQLIAATNPPPPLLNEWIDVSGDFRDFSNTHYLADRLAGFDPATHSGKIIHQRDVYLPPGDRIDYQIDAEPNRPDVLPDQ